MRPENIHLRTATELLEQILARDGTPASATTLHREQQDPAVQLGHATARYVDALHMAAEQLAGPQLITDLDGRADELINRLTEEMAWPALRNRLLLMALDNNTDPIATLRDTMHCGNLTAQLIRLPSSTGGSTTPSSTTRPRRCRGCPASLSASLQTLTGDLQPSLVARKWQLRLNTQLVAADLAEDQQWTDFLAKRSPNVIKDSFLPGLVHRLENLDRAGFDTTALVQSAAAKGPVPDDHPAGALWWRILDELPPLPRGVQISQRQRSRAQTPRNLNTSDIDHHERVRQR